MNNTRMLHASSDWVTSVTLTSPSEFTAPRYLQPLAIGNQQVCQHHFQAHLYQSLRPVVCAQYQKAEQEQRRPDYTTELAHAQREWIKNRQQVSYHKVISSMLSKSTPRKPLARQLLLFLDDTGVIRLGKRVHNAPVSKSTKLLLFPPPKDPFTELDISDTYVNQLYACASSTLNLVRLRYWIPAGRQHVKKAINHCVTCKTIIGLPCNVPDPSLLPKTHSSRKIWSHRRSFITFNTMYTIVI